MKGIEEYIESYPDIDNFERRRNTRAVVYV